MGNLGNSAQTASSREDLDEAADHSFIPTDRVEESFRNPGEPPRNKSGAKNPEAFLTVDEKWELSGLSYGLNNKAGHQSPGGFDDYDYFFSFSKAFLAHVRNFLASAFVCAPERWHLFK